MTTALPSRPVLWEHVAEYVAAGNVVGITIADDLADIELEVVYGNGRIEVTVYIRGRHCRYLDVRRVEHHEPGAAIIYEAYLHDSSSMLQQLHAHGLDGKAGSLLRTDPSQCNGGPRHIEIVGEVSVNAICDEFELTAVGLPV